MPHWLSHVLGLDDASGPYYLFHSGIEGNLALIVSAGVFIRHKNCHTPWCWRIGKHPVDGTPFTVCRKHHPEI